MAKNEKPISKKVGGIRDLLIEEEMKKSYLQYAMSVIVSRALPDARDGLKPSQRRILLAMHDLHLGPRSKHRKCAKIAGDTSGNYHPHGEQVIYPTLVRMAQSFSIRYALVNGQGNFGSIDGDPPAAMRYTEARMQAPAMEMLTDIEKNTVDMTRNYDDTLDEPTILPGKFPNLLVNGSSGIAVGYATSIPPNNLREICDAIVKVIDEPDCAVDDLIKIVKGPDFPTGATICGRDGIINGYRTGRGHITVRARAHTETKANGRVQLVITEIPYQTNKTNIIEKIVSGVKGGRITGISDIRDESDRDGMRLVIEIARGEDEHVVLNNLYKHTQLQDTFSIIMLVLVDMRPRVLNLKEMCSQYIIHRREVIRRRTQFMLDKALARAHILEGLLVAIDHLDEVIKLIRGSEDTDIAREGLMSNFGLSQKQADAILAMRLAQLTGLEREKLRNEYDALLEEIEGYRKILADDRLVDDIIREDIFEIKEKYGDERRTEIVGSVKDIDLADLIAEETVAVVATNAGYIKRMPVTAWRKQGRGGKGITAARKREDDFVEHLFIASTHDYLLFFTDRGRCHWMKVYNIPEMGRASRGRALVNLLQMEKGESVAQMIAVRDFDDRYVAMATRKGIIKKTALVAYSRPRRDGIQAIKLDKDDELIGVSLTSGNDEIILATRAGFAIRFNEKGARPLGRVSRGVKGISLRKGDQVVGMIVARSGGTLLTVCENGFGKRTAYDSYRMQSRGGKGIINIKTSDRNGPVVGIVDVKDDEQIMMVTLGGMMLRCAVANIRAIGRATQGVNLITLNKMDKVVGIAPVFDGTGDEVDEDDADDNADAEPAGDEGENAEE